MYDWDYQNYLDELRAEAADKLGPFCNDPDHEYDSSMGLRGEPIKVAVDKDAERRARFETKDSGKKAKYNDGMQRDTTEGKPQFALLFPEGVPYEDQLMTRVADLYHRGGVKYGPRNWEKSSTQESLDHHKECLLRHVIKFMLGVEDGEDHAAAVVWNVNAVDLTRRKMNTLPDNETTRRIDAFLDSHKEPLSVIEPPPFNPDPNLIGHMNKSQQEFIDKTNRAVVNAVEFSDGDELLDGNQNWWEWSATNSAWYCKAMFIGISELSELAKSYGPLTIETGEFAGLTILKDGSKRWG